MFIAPAFFAPAMRYDQPMTVCTRIGSPRAALSLVPVLLLLAACGDGSPAQTPGDISAGEARALDDAAQMIAGGRPAAANSTPAQGVEDIAPQTRPAEGASPNG